MGRQRRPVGVTPTPPGEPYDNAEVRRRVRAQLESENLIVSRHARERMAECDMNLTDATNILRGGHLADGRGCSHEHGSWRYRLESAYMAVVIAFDEDTGRIVLVTAFRLER